MLWSVALIALNGCSSGDEELPGGQETGCPPEEGCGDSGGGASGAIVRAASIVANPNNPFSALVTVTLDRDAEVVVEYGEGALTHATPAARASAGAPMEIPVFGLRADRAYTFEVTAADGGASWRGAPLSLWTDPLPVGWPVCEPIFIAPETTFDPDEVVCTQGLTSDGQHMYFCTDYWGETVFSVKSTSNDSLMSMRALPDGGWASTSYTNSKLLFFDALGAQTAAYATSYFDGGARFQHDYVDVHELLPISEGAWAGAVAFLTNTYERFDDGSFKLGNGLIVFDPEAREVLYDYSFHGDLGDGVSMDPVKMPYERAGAGDYAEDWNHANTLLHGRDGDGREYFLISLKAQDWIFKLYPDTDELAWALGYEGDFLLVEDLDAAAPVYLSPLDWFYHQHGMVFVEDEGTRTRLLMLDNGYPRRGEDGEHVWDLFYSRLIELRLDASSGLADITYAYGDADYDGDWFFSATCGNAVLLEGGERALTIDGDSDTLLEVSYPGGERRWQMTCETDDWCLYRASWHPNLYRTDWAYE